MTAWCSETWQSISSDKAISKYGATEGKVECPDCGREVKLTIAFRSKTGVSFKKLIKFADDRVRVPPHRKSVDWVRS